MKIYKKCFNANHVFELKNFFGDFLIAVDCIPVPEVSLHFDTKELINAKIHRVTLYLCITKEYNLNKVETFMELHDFESISSLSDQVNFFVGIFDGQFYCPRIFQEILNQIYQ